MSGSLVNLKKIARMEYLTFKNALRLHRDSILLFKARRFPSAFFLSVLSQEELGKATLLSDFVYHSEVDGRMEPQWEHEWLDAIYSHKIKRNVFTRNAFVRLPKSFLTTLADGTLERLKQSAAYVGFVRRGSIHTKLSLPSRISRQQARKQITIVNDYLLVLATGVRKEVYSWDNPDVERLLRSRLVDSLSTLWTARSKSARVQLRRISTVK
jgi:AbiV family abortive infection protein